MLKSGKQHKGWRVSVAARPGRQPRAEARLCTACLGLALLGSLVAAQPLAANSGVVSSGAAANVSEQAAATVGQSGQGVATSSSSFLGQMSAGFLFLYDLSGSVQVQKGSTVVPAALQQTLQADEPLQFTLGKDAIVAVVFSNGVSLWAKGPGSFTVNRFEQLPFVGNSRENGYEPSNSALEINLEQGQFAFAERQLSALSVLRLNFGEGHVLDAHETPSFLVTVGRGAEQDRISVLDGRALLHHYGQKGSAVLIGSGQYLELERGRITQRQQLRLPEQLTSSGREADAHEAYRAQMANDRVWFIREEGAAAASAEVALPANFWLGKPHAATRVR